MKKTFKILGAVMALGLVVLLGLHLFLQLGLTKMMRDVILPRVKAETGLDVRVDRLALNVPNGVLYLKGVEVRNPEGFLLENMASVDRVVVEVDILSLLKQKLVHVKHVEVERVLVNVIRNKAGDLNINILSAKDEQRDPEGGTPGGETAPASEPLPEVLVEALRCNARLRYLDFKLDDLDFTLELNVIGSNLSTQRDPATPWGHVALIGSLGSKRTRFVTDLQVEIAPLVDPQSPSFDLEGKVLEIDPRILDKVYDKLGIRSAPFGLDPALYCRDGRFEDSRVMLNLQDIEFEDKLADRLGGMGSIASLRFPLPVEGTLQKPEVDLEQALNGALGGNAQNLLDAFLKGAAAKEAGLEEPPEDLTAAAVEVLGEHVDEIGESETTKKVLKDLADGETSDTNAPSPISSDILIDILGEQVEEIGEDEVLKDELKTLGRHLFGR